MQLRLAGDASAVGDGELLGLAGLHAHETVAGAVGDEFVELHLGSMEKCSSCTVCAALRWACRFRISVEGKLTAYSSRQETSKIMEALAVWILGVVRGWSGAAVIESCGEPT